MAGQVGQVGQGGGGDSYNTTISISYFHDIGFPNNINTLMSLLSTSIAL